jgi:hypothetical protein
MSQHPVPPPRTLPVRHGDRRLAARRELLLPAIRVSVGERKQIDGEAERMGLALAAYMRRLILGRRLPRAVPPVNREQWAKLGTLAADLNVLAAAAREGQSGTDVLALLAALRAEIASLRDALLGHDPVDR